MCGSQQPPVGHPEEPEVLAVKEALAAKVRAMEEGKYGIFPGEIKVTICRQTQQIPSPLAPYNFLGIRHELHSIPAVVALLLTLGSPDRSIVYYNQSNINGILDKTIQDRPFDTFEYKLRTSPQAEAWRGIFGKETPQKDFIKFLKGREPGEVPDVDSLIAAAKKIKGRFTVITESEYEDSNNLGIVYKVTDEAGKSIDEGSMTLPTRLEVTMPLLEESQELFTIEVELELTKPVDGKPPFFVLSCPKWPVFWREAVGKAVEEMKAELPDYLIMAGEGYERNKG